MSLLDAGINAENPSVTGDAMFSDEAMLTDDAMFVYSQARSRSSSASRRSTERDSSVAAAAAGASGSSAAVTAGSVVISSTRQPRSLLSLSLISLLDADNPSSVIIDVMLSYTKTCEALHDEGGQPRLLDQEADAAPGRRGISDKVGV